MLLSYNELLDLVAQGVIDAPESQINGASIDIRIQKEIHVETRPVYPEGVGAVPTVDITDKNHRILPAFHRITMGPEGYLIPPGGCVLAATIERFRLPPDITSELRIKSTPARCFLNNILATWCDPWWGYETEDDTCLTLELVNQMRYHWFRIVPGMSVGQMIFNRVTPVPRDRGYAVRGSYNGTARAEVSR